MKITNSEDLPNEVIEELLTMSLFVRIQYTEQVDLMRNIRLFKRIEYIRLLNHYSEKYKKFVKITYFTDI